MCNYCSKDLVQFYIGTKTEVQFYIETKTEVQFIETKNIRKVIYVNKTLAPEFGVLIQY